MKKLIFIVMFYSLTLAQSDYYAGIKTGPVWGGAFDYNNTGAGFEGVFGYKITDDLHSQFSVGYDIFSNHSRDDINTDVFNLTLGVKYLFSEWKIKPIICGDISYVIGSYIYDYERIYIDYPPFDHYTIKFYENSVSGLLYNVGIGLSSKISEGLNLELIFKMTLYYKSKTKLSNVDSNSLRIGMYYNF